MAKPCFVCGSDNARPAGHYSLDTGRQKELTFTMPLVECRQCSFVYVSPLPDSEEVSAYYAGKSFWQSKMSTSLDEKFSNWSEVFSNNPSLDERLQRAERQFGYIKQKLPNFSRNWAILDVGAGFSPFLYTCRRQGCKNLFAVEPLEYICNFLKQQGVDIAAATVEDLFSGNFNKKYDLIIVSHTFEHLRDPQDFICQIKKLLNPGGALYIEVPNRDDRQKFHCGLHFLFFDTHTLGAALKRYGLRVIDTVNVRYNLAGLVIRKLLLLFYALFKKRRSFSLQSRAFTSLYYKLWNPLKKFFRIKLYIYISSNDVAALSSLDLLAKAG